MTRTLILIRHAKSSWDHPALSDHDRPLNQRGLRSARALGDWLRRRGRVPDQGLVSSARRTRETWDGLALEAVPEFHDALYHAGAGQMRQVLQQATGQVVLMLGHNPGIADFARRLVRQPPRHDRFFDYPTGATMVADFDMPDWRSLQWGKGELVDFVIPRELPE